MVRPIQMSARCLRCARRVIQTVSATSSRLATDNARAATSRSVGRASRPERACQVMTPESSTVPASNSRYRGRGAGSRQKMRMAANTLRSVSQAT